MFLVAAVALSDGNLFAAVASSPQQSFPRTNRSTLPGVFSVLVVPAFVFSVAFLVFVCSST